MNADLRARPRSWFMWVGFQPDTPVGMNADLRARPRSWFMWVGFQPDTPRRHECRPTGTTSVLAHVGRVSTRHARRHECRPTGTTPVLAHVGRVSTRHVPVGMNADLRARPRPWPWPMWVGFQPDCPSARMPTYGHDPGPGSCGSGFNPTRPRRHECRPTGTTPALAHVGRVSTRLPVGMNADLRTRPRPWLMWVGFQPDTSPSA
jgi:hypothetical protein